MLYRSNSKHYLTGGQRNIVQPMWGIIIKTIVILSGHVCTSNSCDLYRTEEYDVRYVRIYIQCVFTCATQFLMLHFVTVSKITNAPYKQSWCHTPPLPEHTTCSFCRALLDSQGILLTPDNMLWLWHLIMTEQIMRGGHHFTSLISSFRLWTCPTPT